MTQNNWKYCEETTKNHPVYKKYESCCVEYIADVIKKENKKKSNLFENNKYTVINVDSVEKELAKKEKRGENRPTMDIAFGIISKQKKDKNFLLVEFKLNVSNYKNISKTEIKDKVNGTKDIIDKGYYSIYNFYIVIVTEVIKRRHYSEKSQKKESIEYESLSTLKGKYFN